MRRNYYEGVEKIMKLPIKKKNNVEGVLIPRKNYDLKQGVPYRVLFNGTILNEATGVEL
jgi:hypothetical protein